MRTSPRAAIGLFAAGLLAAAALGQDRPESILPPGFGEPAQPLPTPTPRPSVAPSPGTAPITPLTTVQPLPLASDTPTPSPTPTIDPATLAEYELPAFARRSVAEVGPAGQGEGGLAADAFGDADGVYLEGLMRRLSAPLPSRWLSILLRRTLMSRVDTPAHVNGPDFAAERAWLLLRMGESIGARSVVQSVDAWNYTPKLYQVAMNALLASSDPGGLCPLADRGAARTGEAGWTLAQAMCAGLAGQPGRAATLIAAARRGRTATGIDMLLARKVVGTGAQGRQAVTIEWAGVDRLTPWRFGLASATGVAIPDDQFATTGPQVRYWQALSPAVPLAPRFAAADAAAAQGVLSNAALVDLYASVADADDDALPSDAGTLADELRTAYSDPAADARLAALDALWGDRAAPASYARLVLTAHAAAHIAPSPGNDDADRLVASMLSAGLDRTACRWLGSVTAGTDAWAMLVLANPDAYTRLSYSDLSSYAGSGDAAAKQRLLFAGLAGLGRLSNDDVQRAAEALDVRIGAENSWTRAIDRAANDNQPGTVVVLAALGMQTASWRGVNPAMLYRIVAALRSVGLEGEARMIAAEAIARA